MGEIKKHGQEGDAKETDLSMEQVAFTRNAHKFLIVWIKNIHFKKIIIMIDLV